jgi:hypothetical protein
MSGQVDGVNLVAQISEMAALRGPHAVVVERAVDKNDCGQLHCRSPVFAAILQYSPATPECCILLIRALAFLPGIGYIRNQAHNN